MLKLVSLIFYLTLLLYSSTAVDEKYGNIEKLGCSLNWIIQCGEDVSGKISIVVDLEEYSKQNL